MVDVCVIGGGPAGLFSAYYCQSRGLQTMLIEADEQLGGRVHLFKQYVWKLKASVIND